MPRKRKAAKASEALTLKSLLNKCPACNHEMTSAYYNRRRVYTLPRAVDLRLQIRRCENEWCPRYQRPYRPELETRLALPYSKFGLDVIAAVARMRNHNRSNSARIQGVLAKHGLPISLRTVRNLVDRGHELETRVVTNGDELQEHDAKERFVVLDVFWVREDNYSPTMLIVRDCISGLILTARFIRPSQGFDINSLVVEISRTSPIPVLAIVTDDPVFRRDMLPRLFQKHDLDSTLQHSHCCRFPATPAVNAREQDSLASFLHNVTRVAPHFSAIRSPFV